MTRSRGAHVCDSPQAAASQILTNRRHNYGTENDPNYRTLNGNKDEGKGFGHLCISVDHIQAACKRLEDAGYKFQKRLTDGRMRSIAFILDPDEYWVEIIPQKPIETTEQMQTTDLNTYRMVSPPCLSRRLN